LHIAKNKFITKDRGVPSSAEHLENATFAAIVNPAAYSYALELVVKLLTECSSYIN